MFHILYTKYKSRFYTLVSTSLLSLICSNLVMATELQEVSIGVNDRQCDPMDLTVKAGKVRFTIKNNSMRALEWEILDGVMVVEERENIAPGFYQKMTVELEPGTYQTTCGLLTNPRGTLTVLSDEKSQPYQLKAEDKVAISAELKFYLIMTSQQLVPEQIIESSESYYALLAIAPVWTNVDTENHLVAGNTSSLKQQIDAWKLAVKQQTLSIDQVLTQLSESLRTLPITTDNFAGLARNIVKMKDLINPLLTKLDNHLATRLSNDVEKWLADDNQVSRNALEEDLRLVVNHFKED